MMEISPEQFQTLLPLACVWAEEQEQLILQNGIKLTTTQIADAYQIGVAQPEQVRLMQVSKIPLPEHQELRAVAETTQLLSPDANGVTFRYGIYIQGKSWGDRPLIVHELVHTKQYEQMGGFQPFLQQYLMECLTIGYPNNLMEKEAIRVAREICGLSEWEN